MSVRSNLNDIHRGSLRPTVTGMLFFGCHILMGDNILTGVGRA